MPAGALEGETLRVGVPAVLTAALVLAGCAAVAAPPPTPTPERCTVGVAGNAVSVTAEGPGAEAFCASSAGQLDLGFTWYRHADGTTPSAPVICELGVAGVRYTVRDQGMLNLMGTAACDALAREQAERGP